MSDQKPRKHVIFLGAGASMSSGYPSAVELRLLLTSPHEFAKFLENRFKRDSSLEYSWLLRQIVENREKYAKPVEVFRRGGFATVDEFSEVCLQSHPFEVGMVKDYMRIVLASVAPQFTFETSEYPAFIRTLFKSDLRTLRDDVSVLSYNYDPYCDYLLIDSLGVRRPDSIPDSALVSGLCPYGEKLSEREGFCFLKLHGAICLTLPSSKRDDHPTAIVRLMDTGNPHKFLTSLFSDPPEMDGPLFFPWEIWGSQGMKIEEKDRRGREIFRDIWERARSEVQSATKVSFVGLSMHEYLKPGLRYLFEGKSGSFQVVVANPDIDKYAKHFDAARFAPHPGCSHTRIRKAVREFCPGAQIGSDSIQHPSTYLRNFTEFIDREMAPVT